MEIIVKSQNQNNNVLSRILCNDFTISCKELSCKVTVS